MTDPSTRARDSDRDRVVAALDEAYVDGQLSDSERSLRVSQALGARTLGDLDALVRDLQGVKPVASGVSKWSIAIAVAAAAVALLIIAGLMSLVSGGDPDESATAAGEPVEVHTTSAPPIDAQTESAEKQPDTAEERPETAAKPLTREYFEEFQRAYRERFGGTRIWDAGYYDAGYVVFKRPYSLERKDLLQDWDWYPDRGFEKSIIDASTNVFGYTPFDLSTVNYKALARHVAQGRKYLGVTNPEMRVSMSPQSEDLAKVIEIIASNSHGDYGTRYVAPGGRLIDSHPFVVPDQQ